MFPTKAKWIADTSRTWRKKQSPVPVVFQKQIVCKGNVRHAVIHAAAMGIYELELNGKRVGDSYFAPGFTSYRHQLQYQSHDVAALLKEENILRVTVAGGWVVGKFLYKRSSRLAADYPSLLMEMKLQYEDGREEILCTDESWQVTVDGPVRAANWYDGETYDATKCLADAEWRPAKSTSVRGNPKLLPQYGPPVTVWNTLRPVSVKKAANGEWLYDFGQNFAGVLSMNIQGKAGRVITVRHAELLKDGQLYTVPLRSAKATLTYTCREGSQYYSLRFTYMGFRYAGISGIEPEQIKVTAPALSSELKETGSFLCSNEQLNRLNENIRWSARSNFVDIPTDCPQRDERLGWTRDIAVFARTACWNYDTSSFFSKWLRDVRSEQGRFGGIPMVVPRNGHLWPPFTTACWGDCCILVPWAEYLARGDLDLLRELSHHPKIPAVRKALGGVVLHRKTEVYLEAPVPVRRLVCAAGPTGTLAPLCPDVDEARRLDCNSLLCQLLSAGRKNRRIAGQGTGCGGLPRFAQETFDGWYTPKTYHDYSRVFEENWRADIAAMVEASRNHPCVLLYSIGNEVSETAAERGVNPL